jgi:hypothetical protein
MQNRRPKQLPRRGPQTSYKGVSGRYTKTRGIVWRAAIRANGHLIQLGAFASDVEAAYAYDRAAIEHFGPFARLNSYASD